ncbi:MAG: hypothetical protein WC285_01955 [Candidatus Gracilibacteria bacterium]|jgi:hypothetical protein
MDKIVERKICRNCSQNFDVTDKDVKFYERINVPHPNFCPTCRQQRRTMFRNESSLYHRKCDYTGEKIISIYSDDKPYKVYKTDIWWTDKWNPLDYGQGFDFSRPFFEQFKELQLKVPRPALTIAQLENSPFVNQAWFNKNCHLCFDMGYVEDGLYCYKTYYGKNLVDNDSVRDSELCYGLLDCQKCYNCFVLKDCSNCHDSYFSFDCKGCANIAFCSNLRNKDYYIFNKSVSKEEFEKFTEEFKKGSYQNFQKYTKDFKEKVIGKAIHKLDHNLNTENCTGDYLLNSKNCVDSYLGESSQDTRYCTGMDEKIQDSMDLDGCAKCELAYEGMCVNGMNVKFCTYTYMDVSDCTYCDITMASLNCFGCIGLQHKNYCILNKQYTKEEYEKLLPKIIEHMRRGGEFGEFFPASLSTFCCNETVAHEYFPLTKEEALQKGYKWKDVDKKEYQNQTHELPDSIIETSDSVINEILACEQCSKNYKITQAELNFYRKIGLPIPRKCHVCRHLGRIAFRNPRKLTERNCDKCGTKMITTYTKENPATVYCEKCYLESII